MKGTGPKPLSGSVRVDAQPGSSMVSKGSPSSKENSGPGMFAGIPVASLKHSLKNRQPKLGSPGNEHTRNTKGSPDIMRHEQALKLLQSKMPNFTHRPMPSDLQSAQDRHTGLIFSQPGAAIGRALGKKASTSPSPGPGSPGGRDTSANRSFTDNASPKPGSPPKKVSYQTSKAGPGSPKQTPGSPSIHSSGGSTSGMRTLAGSPETAGPEYLLNPHKHKNQVVQLNGANTTYTKTKKLPKSQGAKASSVESATSAP